VVTDQAKGKLDPREKLDAKGKRALAEKLLTQAAEDEAKEPVGR
jgi:hypothetical protein